MNSSIGWLEFEQVKVATLAPPVSGTISVSSQAILWQRICDGIIAPDLYLPDWCRGVGNGTWCMLLVMLKSKVDHWWWSEGSCLCHCRLVEDWCQKLSPSTFSQTWCHLPLIGQYHWRGQWSLHLLWENQN